MKQVNDLEAHLNTSIITEKSVRKAQDKYLAEEIDKFSKQMASITDKLKIHIDEEGNVIAQNKSKAETDFASTVKDIKRLEDQVGAFNKEIGELKEKVDKAGSSEAVKEAMEASNAKLAEVQTQLDTLKKQVEGEGGAVTTSQVD